MPSKLALAAPCRAHELRRGRGHRTSRSVFLHEPDEDQLIANFAGREPADGEQRHRARVSLLFGEWLAAQAAREGIPVIRPRPWTSLERRVLAALDRS